MAAALRVGGDGGFRGAPFPLRVPGVAAAAFVSRKDLCRAACRPPTSLSVSSVRSAGQPLMNKRAAKPFLPHSASVGPARCASGGHGGRPCGTAVRTAADVFLIPFGRPVEEFAAASSRAEAGLDPARDAALDIGGRARDLVPVTWELSVPGPVSPPVRAAEANQRSPFARAFMPTQPVPAPRTVVARTTVARSRNSRLDASRACWSEKLGSKTPPTRVTGSRPR